MSNINVLPTFFFCFCVLSFTLLAIPRHWAAIRVVLATAAATLVAQVYLCWILRMPQRVHPHDPGVDIASISGPRVYLHARPILFHFSAHMTGLPSL